MESQGLRRGLLLGLAVVLLAALLPATAAQAARKLSIDDETVAEADGEATFTVTLSKKAKRTVKVRYSTADDTATAVDDYAHSSGTLKIQPKRRKATLDIDIVDDDESEGDELFKVGLSKARRARIDDGDAFGTILDDEPAAATLYEINDGTVPSGTEVAVQNAMVTAVLGTTAWIGVQSVDSGWEGADNSAIEVDFSGVIPTPVLVPGVRVDVEGSATADLLTADEIVADDFSTALPNVVDPFTLATSPPALDAVLVRINDTNIDSQNDGDWQLSAGVTIDNAIIGSLPASYQNGPLASVVGIAEMSGSPALLRPRTNDDILPGLAAFTGLPDTCINIDDGPAAIGTVTLTGPPTTSTEILLTSSDPDVATVPGSVTIAQGSTFAEVSATPLSEGETTITAQLGNTVRIREVAVGDPCT